MSVDSWLLAEHLEGRAGHSRMVDLEKIRATAKMFLKLGIAFACVLGIGGLGVLGGLNPWFAWQVGVVIPYLAFSLFVGGVVVKVLAFAKRPVPFCTPLTAGQQRSLIWIQPDPIENPSSALGVALRVMSEALLFRSLIRDEKSLVLKDKDVLQPPARLLWGLALLFHASLLVILLRHLRFALEPVPSAVVFLGQMDELLDFGIPRVFLTDILIGLALLGLLVRRIIQPKMRLLSLTQDYFFLLLLLGIVLTGVWVREVNRVDVAQIKEFVLGIVAFKPRSPERLGTFFLVHLTLASALAASFPFGKLIHMVGAWLSPTRTLPNTPRRNHYQNPWDYPVKLHAYEAYEEEFKDKMLKAGLSLDLDQKETPDGQK